MKPIYFFSALILMVFNGCREKNNKPPIVEEPTSVVVVPNEYACENIPPEPEPFGWRDSSASSDENVIAFTFNPTNNDEIIYIVEGDITGYNQMFNYNFLTKKKISLGSNGSFLPSINKNGWLVYGTVDNNIYKIKVNGDSLTPVNTNYRSFCPRWDYNGAGIYYFQEAFGTVASIIVKVNANGSSSNFLMPAELPHHATFCKSDKLLYLRTSATAVTIIERNLETNAERTLISGPFNSKTGQVHFNNLCVDREDQNFFWSNSYGVFKCNLQTLKTDTLLKNCPNITYYNPLMSFKDNELSVAFRKVKPISQFVLFNQFKAMQIDLLTTKMTEVRIFP